MTNRSHLLRPLQDESGNIFTENVTVEIVDPVTHVPVTFPLYTTALGGADFDNPAVVIDGYLDVWADDDQYISLKITPSGGIQMIFDYVEISKPEGILTDVEVAALEALVL